MRDAGYIRRTPDKGKGGRPRRGFMDMGRRKREGHIDGSRDKEMERAEGSRRVVHCGEGG